MLRCRRLVVGAGVLAGWAVAAQCGEVRAEEVEPTKARPAHALDNAASHFKPGSGVTFASEDGQFEVAIRTRAQFRYSLFLEEEEDAADRIEIRRSRLQLQGHFFGEHNRFKAEFAFSPADVSLRDGAPVGTSPLLDYYFDFTHLRDLSARVGTYKIPFNRQRVISSGNLQLVDRSIINSEFNLDRDLGVDIRSKDFLGLGQLRYYAGYYSGKGRNARGSYELSDNLYLARLEWLPLGMFKDYSEADLARKPDARLSLGLGYARRNATDPQGVDYDNLTWDVMFKMAGFSLFSEWAYRNGDPTTVDLDGTLETLLPSKGLGGMVQAGYLFPGSEFEVAARVGRIRRSGETNESTLNDRGEFGGGVGYYFGGHAFKLQADYFRLTEDGRGDQDQVRVQLQAGL